MSADFGLILFCILVVMLAIMLLDQLFFKKQRLPRKQAYEQAKQNPGQSGAYSQVGKPTVLDKIIEIAYGFFGVVLLVFVLRSFVAEPFKIPSGSMLPTLQSGDMILVNKFTYGIRLPVINQKIIDIGAPERGDVVVFRFPPDPKVDYIKRVVGVPGDEVHYDNATKTLQLNGQTVAQKPLGDYIKPEQQAGAAQRFAEQLGEHEHDLLKLPINTVAAPEQDFSGDIQNCHYQDQGFTCKVPEGYYFVMGDNRDNSRDSRFWGFVPDQNLVGKAFFIWMNWQGEFSRLGSFK
ncbi:signal peptidase I [Brackiella oedipodis]|uniref:signal peptidase I n=1 Tax=Brackiella oedipodis TaxID=124225 RepID=UPI0004919899|nr:signal peptidase I [Brackiella oedipodis]